MRTTWVLFVKELKALFNSWIAYVVLISFTALSGLTFFLSLQMFEILTRYSKTVQEGAARQNWSLVDHLIQPLYGTIFILLFVMVPGITMRLFAEEKRQRTEELLLTSPIRVISIVLGKYLAAVALITIMLIPTAIFPGLCILYGRPFPDWGPMLTGYIALFLLGYGLAAIGVFASTLTENQIVAFVLTVALEMLFFMLAQSGLTFDLVRIGDLMFNAGSFLRAFSITEHFDALISGLFRLSDVVYFLSLILFWLWAAWQSVESARWGGQ